MKTSVEVLYADAVQVLFVDGPLAGQVLPITACVKEAPYFFTTLTTMLDSSKGLRFVYASIEPIGTYAPGDLYRAFDLAGLKGLPIEIS